MSRATPSRLSPHARLLPARDAFDYDYFRERLADPALADAGVAVALFRIPLLAAPVGGDRRGGYLSFGRIVDAVAARTLLSAVPGFPDLRIRWSPRSDICHTLEWGEPRPPWWASDEVMGSFYGYSTDAIAAFVQARTQVPSPALAEACFPPAQSARQGGEQ